MRLPLAALSALAVLIVAGGAENLVKGQLSTVE